MAIVSNQTFPKVLGITEYLKALRTVLDIFIDLRLKVTNKFLTLAEERQKVLKTEI